MFIKQKFRQNLNLLLLTLGVVVLTFFSSASNTLSQNSLPKNSGSTFTELQKQLQDNLKKQNELQKKITDSQNQERSLANQIVIVDSEITLTELKIDETENRIAQLAIDVVNTENKLTKTQGDLDYKTEIANKRIRAIYEQGYVRPLELMLGTDGFNNYLVLQKYTEAIHDSDIRLITSLKELKETYAEEKDTLSNQKKSAEDLKVQLDGQKSSLDSQRKQKSILLEVTKNNEQNYQRALAQSKLDQQVIQNALFNLGTKLGPVKKGEVIAFQGNTGCSTGTHLHFGYLVGGRAVDPMAYLNSGALTWPETNPRITQGFGANAAFYAQLGQPGGHPAIDMTAGWNAPIYAAKSGTAYLGSDNGCPSLIPGTGKGKGIIIDHGDGTKTIYWHIR